MPGFYNKAERFVIKSFYESKNERSVRHFKRTVFWVKKLRPDADDALLVAAIAHDVERAFRGRDVHEKIRKSREGLTGKDHLRYHEEKSADIICNFLSGQGAGAALVERVRMLVSRHEEGGNDDQNLLMDADSISFFENNVSHFLKTKTVEFGKKKIRKKFDWMYERIKSEKARVVSKSWYEKAIATLEKI